VNKSFIIDLITHIEFLLDYSSRSKKKSLMWRPRPSVYGLVSTTKVRRIFMKFSIEFRYKKLLIKSELHEHRPTVHIS